MDREIQSLIVQNEREAHEVEQIFYDVKAIKEKVASLEKDLQLVNFNFKFIIIQLIFWILQYFWAIIIDLIDDE